MAYVGNTPSKVPLTSADIADGIITTAKIADGNITSTKILDGTILNADINASAAIASTKLSGVTSEVKAWIKFNGNGTPSINGSGNVSSITDNGTGDYIINFTTALTDTNYGFVASADGGGSGSISFCSPVEASQATTSSRIRVWNTSFNLSDSIMVSIAFFR
jgi:hypothetical protein